MPTFPRNLVDLTSHTILPVQASWPSMPEPLSSIGFSGKSQYRDTASAGFAWVEEIGLLDMADPSARKLLAQVRLWNRTKVVLDVEHLDIEKLGAGGGTPLVKGASQTGNTLLTDGWPVSTDILKAGDFIRATSLQRAFEVTADVTSDGSGNATVSINPTIFAGSSPVDNDPITIADTGVAFFKARIIAFTPPTRRPRRTAQYYATMRIAFREAV